jgi:hypothetical protein
LEVKPGEKPKLQGEIEITLEVMHAKNAERIPAGKARSEPNMNPIL